MSVTNNIVSKTDSTSISEVSSLIGAGTNDLGTLCKHANIKMWARYKPVVNASVSSSNDGKGGDGNYGFSVVTASSLATLVSSFDNGMNGWAYVKPSGGASSPYRLGDFRGYNHNVLPPIGDFANVTSHSVGTELQLTAISQITEDTTVVPLYDVAAIKDSNGNAPYFGVAMIMSGETSYDYVTNSERFNGAASIKIPADFFPSNKNGKTVTVYPIFSTAARTSASASQGTSKFAFVPNMKSLSFVLQTATADFNGAILATYNTAKTQISVSGTLTKNRNVTANNVYIYVKFANSDDTTTLKSGELSYHLVDQTLSVGASANIDFREYGTSSSIAQARKSVAIPTSMANNCKVLLYVAGNLVAKTIAVDAQGGGGQL